MTISRPEPVARPAVDQSAADQFPAERPAARRPAAERAERTGRPERSERPTVEQPTLPAGRAGDVHPVLRRSTASPAALELLRHAHRTLVHARGRQDPLERYATAHLAALRATAAVLAVRGRPVRHPRRRQAIRPAWELLPEVAPELAEWAAYFAAGARRRAAAEAGITGAAGPRDADDLIRNTALYLRIVERILALHP